MSLRLSEAGVLAPRLASKVEVDFLVHIGVIDEGSIFSKDIL